MSERGGPGRQQAGASTLRFVVAVVKLMSPEKHEGAAKTVAGPALSCSTEAQEGADPRCRLFFSLFL